MSKKTSPATDLALIVTFAALIAALTMVPAIPLGPAGVPLTLQTLGVLLAGALLGAKRGAAAVALYVFLGAVGLPIFSGAKGGIAVLLGPTGGFLLGFILAAFVTGLLTKPLLPTYPWVRAFLATLAGATSVYLIGAPWLIVVTGAWQSAAGLVVFIPGDLIKVVIAVVIAKFVHRAFPALHKG